MQALLPDHTDALDLNACIKKKRQPTKFSTEMMQMQGYKRQEEKNPVSVTRSLFIPEVTSTGHTVSILCAKRERLGACTQFVRGFNRAGNISVVKIESLSIVSQKKKCFTCSVRTGLWKLVDKR